MFNALHDVPMTSSHRLSGRVANCYCCPWREARGLLPPPTRAPEPGWVARHCSALEAGTRRTNFVHVLIMLQGISSNTFQKCGMFCFLEKSSSILDTFLTHHCFAIGRISFFEYSEHFVYHVFRIILTCCWTRSVPTTIVIFVFSGKLSKILDDL